MNFISLINPWLNINYQITMKCATVLKSKFFQKIFFSSPHCFKSLGWTCGPPRWGTSPAGTPSRSGTGRRRWSARCRSSSSQGRWADQLATSVVDQAGAAAAFWWPVGGKRGGWRRQSRRWWRGSSRASLPWLKTEERSEQSGFSCIILLSFACYMLTIVNNMCLLSQRSLACAYCSISTVNHYSWQ